ncbi:hypothetical protein DUI87_08821 [Hirundo rustica rustica]|uniref:Uncharacterized protein n=1 Tax=Hirundo rustica rustica TaxID=333673 RepID=A0A3M0KKF7_HIRRU|nr:hypothetical protein DUI87_08821 [Hirundo rustica rustica]
MVKTQSGVALSNLFKNEEGFLQEGMVHNTGVPVDPENEAYEMPPELTGLDFSIVSLLGNQCKLAVHMLQSVQLQSPRRVDYQVTTLHVPDSQWNLFGGIMYTKCRCSETGFAEPRGNLVINGPETSIPSYLDIGGREKLLGQQGDRDLASAESPALAGGQWHQNVSRITEAEAKSL